MKIFSTIKIVSVAFALGSASTGLAFNWSDWNMSNHVKDSLAIFDASEPILDLTQIPDHLLTSYAKFNYAQEQKLTEKLGLRIEDGGKVAGQSLPVIPAEAGIQTQSSVSGSQIKSGMTPVVTQEITKVIKEINNYTVKASLTEQELLSLISSSDTLKALLKGDKGDPGITLGYTLPTSTNTNSMGTIAGFTHLSGQDLSAQTLNVSSTTTLNSLTVTGSASLTNPVITNISPGADFTITQNSVIPFTSVNAGAVANTLYLKAGNVGIGTNNPERQFVVDSASGPIIGLYTNGSERALLRADTSGNFIIDANGGEKVRVTSTGNLQFNQNSIISRGTSDGSDNGVLELSGGGATGTSRGGSLLVYGNEHATLPGYARVQLGNGTSHFQVMDNDSTTALLDVDRGSGNLTIAPGTGGAFVLGGTAAGIIRKNTSDGSDNGYLGLSGGGASEFANGAGTRGAGIAIQGNENTDVGPGGSIYMHLGNNSGANYYLRATPANLYALTMAGNTGAFTFTGTDINYFNSNYGSDRTWKFWNTHASSPYGIQVEYKNAAPNGVGNEFFYAADTGGQRMTVRSNGGIANYSANNVNLSDERTKNILGPLDSQWDKWKQLEFLNYQYKDNPNQNLIGLTAQRTQLVFPEIISNFDPERLGIRESELFMLMGRVVQEAQTKIEELEIKLTVLETASGQITSNDNSSGISLSNVKDIVSISGKWSIDESGQLTVTRLCIGQTCVDEDELKALKALIQNQSPTSSTVNGEVAGESTPSSDEPTSPVEEPVSEPSTPSEPEPQSEPLPDPAVIP